MARVLDADAYAVDIWQERDRLGVWVTRIEDGETVAECWDDDARSMFEDGFFKMRDLKGSVLAYYRSVGII